VRLHYIDTMRGIAILMVILTHTAQSVVGISTIMAYTSLYGQMGVQLFFVVSAYTLCHSWSNRTGEHNKLLNYGIRRYFRIAPMYYLGILIYFLSSISENYHVGQILTPGSQYSITNIATNIFFLHGLYPPANNNIVPGGWSVGTEMLFYFILPVLIGVFTKIKSFKLIKLLMLPVLVLAFSQISLQLILFSTEMSLSNNNFMYFNIIVQLPVFCLGMSYYFLCQSDLSPTKSIKKSILGFFLFTFISVYLFYVNISYLFSIIPFVSGISFLFLMRIFECNQALNIRIIRKIGKASFSMYVIHFLYAWKVSAGVSGMLASLLGSDLALIVLYIMTVTFTYLIASLSEKYIEAYFITIGKRLLLRLNY